MFFRSAITRSIRTFFSCAPLTVACILLGAGALGAPALGGEITLHVDATGSPGGNGLSWPAAFTHPQGALNAAANLPGDTVLIKIAQGRYVPTKRTDLADPRSVTFQLRNHCTLQGGYAGWASPSAFDCPNASAIATIPPTTL